MRETSDSVKSTSSAEASISTHARKSFSAEAGKLLSGDPHKADSALSKPQDGLQQTKAQEAKSQEINQQWLKPQETNQQRLKPQETNQQRLKPQEINQQRLKPQEINQQRLKPQEITQQQIKPQEVNQQQQKFHSANEQQQQRADKYLPALELTNSGWKDNLHDASIIVVRHGEKPEDESKEKQADGKHDDGEKHHHKHHHGQEQSDIGEHTPKNPNLSQLGETRAEHLATWIPQQFGRDPNDLFATAPSANSNRPVETLTPLSNSLGGKEIQAEFADKNYGDLASKLDSLQTNGQDQYDHKDIVIAWHHGKIGKLLQALGAPKGSYPDKSNPMSGNDYNDAFRIDYGADGTPTVRELSEGMSVPGEVAWHPKTNGGN